MDTLTKDSTLKQLLKEAIREVLQEMHDERPNDSVPLPAAKPVSVNQAHHWTLILQIKNARREIPMRKSLSWIAGKIGQPEALLVRILKATPQRNPDTFDVHVLQAVLAGMKKLKKHYAS